MLENLNAQHAVAMESHARSHKAVESIEVRAHDAVQRIAHDANRWHQAKGVWYPLVTFVAIVFALVSWYGRPIFDAKQIYGNGYRSGVEASFRNDAAEYLHQRAHWNARVSTLENKQ